MSEQWRWKVAGYYNDTVKKPKEEGMLAKSTGHSTTSSKDMEVAAFKSRKDIGRVIVWERKWIASNAMFDWVMVWSRWV